MRFLSRLLLLSGFTLAATAQAQQPPRIWLPPEADLKPIVLDTVAIAVTMRGFMAHTRIEMSFENPNARVLEGEFVFPLGPGQTVSGYALEVNGTMREGVVVPKQTARVAFEDTIRQQIDPGLAELTRGNVFRTRLYPIPAKGTKRIALEFEQVMDDAGTHWRYLLPLQLREPVKHFSVTAEAPLDAPAPELGNDSPDAQMRFTQTASVWRAEFSRENITPQRELAFRVPKQASDVTVLEAPDPLEPAQRAVLALVDTGRPEHLPAPTAPRRIALFVDASGSASDRDLVRERAALEAWFKTLGKVTVDLVAFRDVADAPRTFQIKNGDASTLLDALQALPLDGASNYGAIDWRATASDTRTSAPADLAVVVGDGLDTFGSGRIDFSGAPPRLFVLHAAQRTDPVRLAEIARHGGELLDLTRIDAGAAVAALAAPGWRLLAVESNGVCTDLAPRAPQPVGKVLNLTARCTGKGVLKLRFGSADGSTQVQRELAVGTAQAASGAVAGSVWRAVAQARIAQLQAAASPDVEAITHLAVRHGVVTAHTSLLVLDRIEDYVRYRVEPKEAALRAEYARLVAQIPKAGDGGDRDTRIADLAKRWNAFRAWHTLRHPWLETLLLPTAQGERDVWQQLTPNAKLAEKRLAANRKQLDEVLAQSRTLAERWTRDGTEPATRATWEREATALMLRIDALRKLRLEVAPDLDLKQQLAEEAMPSPVPMSLAAPPPPPAPPAQERTASNQDRSQTLDRIEVQAGGVAGDTAASRSAAKAQDPSPPELTAQIQLSGWNPDTPYLKTLRAAKDPYAAYLELRKENANTPTFFLDTADFFRSQARQSDLALRVLSNLAEIGDENTALIRILGYRLAQWDRPELAVRPFEDALAQRPEEPQSRRDLALALARLASPDTARAAQLLWEVASGSWSSRFPEVDLIALHELTALLAAHPGTDIAKLNIPVELLTPLETGLRVVLTWDADNTDIDLHVIDPAGEEVFYSHPRSRSGGNLSRDFTQGYGPEVFTITRPLPGTYRIQTKDFGDRRQSLTGPVSVQVEFQTGFGSTEPTRQATTRRLETGKERIDIGQFRVAPEASR